jgi:tape measure domain-containing protein
MAQNVGSISFDVELNLRSLDREIQQVQARLANRKLEIPSVKIGVNTEAIQQAVSEFERLGQQNFDDLELLRVDPATKTQLEQIESAIASIAQKNREAAAESQKLAQQAAVLRQSYGATDEEIKAIQTELARSAAEAQKLAAQAERISLKEAEREAAELAAEAARVNAEFERLAQRNFDDLQLLRTDPATRQDLDKIEVAIASATQKSQQFTEAQREAARQAAILRQQYDLTDAEVAAVQGEIARAAAEAQRLAAQAERTSFREAEREAEALARETARAADEARKLAEQASRESEILKVNPATKGEVSAINRAIREVEEGNRSAARQAAILRQQYGLSEDEVRDVERALERAKGEAKGLSGAAASFVGNLGAQAVQAGLQAITQAIQSIIAAVQGLTAESLGLAGSQLQVELALGSVFTAQGEVAEQLQFVRQVADQTGGSYAQLGQEYSRFAAAASLAGVRTEDLKAVFAETSRVAATFGATAADQNLILNALSQIASKGVVSMEELRQQLGERLPVAFEATARGLGVTQQELNDLVSSGDLTAREFFPAFAEGLRTIGGEISSFSQSIGEFGNELDAVKLQFGQALLPIQEALAVFGTQVLQGFDGEAIFAPLTAAANEFTQALQDSPEIAQELGSALNEVAQVLVGGLANAIVNLTAALRENPGLVKEFGENIVFAAEALNRLLDITARLAVLLGGLTFDAFTSQRESVEGFERALDGIGSLSIPNILVGVNQLLEGIGDLNPALDRAFLPLRAANNVFLRLLDTVNSILNRLGQDSIGVEGFQSVGDEAQAAVEGFDALRNAAAELAPSLESSLDVDTAEITGNVVSSAQDVFKRFKDEGDATFTELLTARDNFLANINRLEANGVITAQEAAAARVSIEKTADKQIEESRKETLDTFERNISRTLTAIDQSAQQRINNILQQQASGAIGEDEAAAKIREINDRLANDTIFAKQKEIEKVKQLEADKVISAEEAADQIQGLQGEILDATQRRLNLELQAQQQVKEEALKGIQEQVEASQQLAENAASQQITAVLADQSNGSINASEAAQRIQEVNDQLAADAIATKQQEIAEVQRLEREKVITAEEAADRIKELQGEIETAVLDRVRNEAAALEQIAGLDEQQQINSVLSLQSEGQIDAEEAGRRIQEINLRTTEAAIQAKQDEVAEITRLEAQKAINSQDAATRIGELNQQIADLTASRLNQEIGLQESAKQAAIDKLDEELAAIQQVQEANNIRFELAGQAIANEQALLQAGVGLAQSRAALEQQRLQGALATAELEGDTTESVRLQGEILQNQIQAIEQEFEAKQRILDLTEQQARLDAQRQIQAAEYAAIEAQIAVDKARQSGATADEVNGLQELANLRLAQVDAARDNASVQDQLLSIQREQLGVQKNISLEQLRQNEIQKRTNDLYNARRGLVAAIARESSTAVEDSLEQLGKIEENLKDARRAGLVGGEQGRAVSSAVAQVERALNSGNSDRALLRLLERERDNPEVRALVDAIGRSDLTGLVEASENFKEASENLDQALTEFGVTAESASEASRAGLDAALQSLGISNANGLGFEDLSLRNDPLASLGRLDQIREGIAGQLERGNPSQQRLDDLRGRETALLVQNEGLVLVEILENIEVIRDAAGQIAGNTEGGLGPVIESLNVSTPDPVGDTAAIVSDVAALNAAGVNA